MIKLTELKRLIKSNNMNNMFYQEGFTKLLFNYENKLIINLAGLDIKKFFEYIKSLNMCNNEYEIYEMYINKKLPDTFKYFADQLHNDKSVKLQIETNIQFKSIISPYHEVFTIYKSENGLIKIDTELLSFLDMKETYLFAGLDNNVVYIFNNTNDFIGICLCSKFDLSELNVNIEL